MDNPDDYVTLKAHRDARNEARQTKKRLNLSWSRFLRQAANELDPDSSD